MSRYQFFAVGSAVIFLLERALPALTSWPLFLFPVFVILFLLTSKSDATDLPYIAVAAIFFDFFSGHRLGFFTAAILAIYLLIHLFKTRISVNTKSFFSLFFYSLIFIFGFLALLSIQPSPLILSSLTFLILIQAVIVASLFMVFSRKTAAKL